MNRRYPGLAAVLSLAASGGDPLPQMKDSASAEFRTSANYRRKQDKRWRAAHGGRPPKSGKGRRAFPNPRQNRAYIPPKKARLQRRRESGEIPTC